MMRIFFRSVLILLAVLLTANVFRADVPAPPVGETIVVEVGENYPDYQFYIASYKRESRPNPKPPHISRPDVEVNLPESFNLEEIDLSAKHPHVRPIGSGRIKVNRWELAENVYWLVAVKKPAPEGLRARVRELIDKYEDGEGIYLARLNDSFELGVDEGKGAKVIVNKVKSLSEKGLEISVSEGGKLPSVASRPMNLIGFGLILTGLALLGFWWTKRKYA
ncbi:MAG: hypothetical protein R2747_18605 [Pyrinomonadaceae bacterium]